jgi:NDP-sugar pyrophosphorylase family protein
MRAMILAAGYGTRLWPLTIDRAKPAIPFMGRPLVGYVAEYVARFGCRDVVVNLHHQSESVRSALGDGSRFGVRLSYVEEPVILGTSGALDNARELLEDETFVVINGKIATDIDLGAALDTHRRTGAIATLVLMRNPRRERFSTVLTRDGRIHSFGPFPKPLASDNVSGREMPSKQIGPVGEAGGGVTGETSGDRAVDGRAVLGASDAEDVPLMFTGIQILEPRIFDYIPRGVFSHSVTDVYPQAIERGEVVAAHVAEGMWYELSTIQRYLEISLALMRREGRSVEVGEGSVIDAGAHVEDAVLWENVRVEAGARVSRAVLGAGVRIPAGEVVEDAAVVRAEIVRAEERPEKALPGEVRGANFVVPLPR